MAHFKDSQDLQSVLSLVIENNLSTLESFVKVMFDTRSTKDRRWEMRIQGPIANGYLIITTAFSPVAKILISSMYYHSY